MNLKYELKREEKNLRLTYPSRFWRKHALFRDLSGVESVSYTIVSESLHYAIHEKLDFDEVAWDAIELIEGTAFLKYGIYGPALDALVSERLLFNSAILEPLSVQSRLMNNAPFGITIFRRDSLDRGANITSMNLRSKEIRIGLAAETFDRIKEQLLHRSISLVAFDIDIIRPSGLFSTEKGGLFVLTERTKEKLGAHADLFVCNEDLCLPRGQVESGSDMKAPVQCNAVYTVSSPVLNPTNTENNPNEDLARQMSTLNGETAVSIQALAKLIKQCSTGNFPNLWLMFVLIYIAIQVS